MTGISSWARFWARYGPDRPALVHEDGNRSWGELEEHCAALAAGFLAAGLRKGDRVGGLLRNGPAYIEAVLGCARIGGIFVPLNPLLTASELRMLAEDAGLAALVTDASFTAVLGPFDELIGAERIFFAGDPPDGGRPLAELLGHGSVSGDGDVHGSDPIMICYTSGTTGRPKGAVLTHANMAAVARRLKTALTQARAQALTSMGPEAVTSAEEEYRAVLAALGAHQLGRPGLATVTSRGIGALRSRGVARTT